ncbi:hypothetical protein BTJ40_06910 [Microbulbifer sp. A4B17]|nr:hypothetical protein BTJ40_06910 [Microbulbifer sp. A4B17]
MKIQKIVALCTTMLQILTCYAIAWPAVQLTKFALTVRMKENLQDKMAEGLESMCDAENA